MRTLWARYFLRESSRVLCLFLFCFYFLYVLIDYASHVGRFAHGSHILRWSVLFRYYFSLFILHLDILLPLGILLSVIKTLCQFNVHFELLALQVGSISLKRLLRPLLFLGLAGTCLLYVNEQFLLPMAAQTIQRLDHAYRLEKSKKAQQPMVHFHHLSDHSILLYHTYHPDRQFFTDVYWILSHDDIYHMQYLYPYTEITIGQYVDHFVRNTEGKMVIDKQYETKSLSSLRLDKERLRDVVIPFQERSIIDLWKKRPMAKETLSEENSQLLASLYGKLTFPWLCLFAVWGPAPSCVRFRNDLPVFMIYLCSIFGLVGLYMIFDALQIIATRQVITPFWAIWPFFTLLFLIFGYRYSRL